MLRNPDDPTVIDPSCTSTVQASSKSLTGAQLEFARLVGRLMAQRWQQEQQRTETSHAGVD
jgi:hypothetical protein